MRPHVYEFVKQIHAAAAPGLGVRRVVEFGSLAVGGDLRARDVFVGRSLKERAKRPFVYYLGVDMRSGPGVDMVDDLHTLDPHAQAYDNVGLCLLVETLEHVERPWEALANVKRILSRGPGPGLCVVTVPFVFGLHDFPNDYWRISTAGLASLFVGAGFRSFAVGQDPLPPHAHPHTVVGAASATGEVSREVLDVVFNGTWRTGHPTMIPVMAGMPALAASFKTVEERDAFEKAVGPWWESQWPKK